MAPYFNHRNQISGYQFRKSSMAIRSRAANAALQSSWPDKVRTPEERAAHLIEALRPNRFRAAIV